MISNSKPIQNPNKQFIEKLNVLTSKDPLELTLKEIQYLVRLAQRTKEECIRLAERGGARIFLKLLETKNEQIIKYVFRVITRIAVNSRQHRQQIITSGGMHDILMVTQRMKNNPLLFRMGLWALGSLIINTRADFLFIVPVIRQFCELIVKKQIQRQEILEMCVTSIGEPKRNDRKELIKKFDIFIQTNLVSKLIELLHHHSDSLVLITVNLLAQISMGSSEQIQYFLSYGVIRQISFLLSSSSLSSRKKVCSIYFNIVTDSQKQAIFFLEHQDIVQNLLFMFKNDQIQIGVTIAKIFSNLIRYELDNNIVQTLFGPCKLLMHYIELLLRCEAQKEYHFLEAAILCLHRIFKNCSTSLIKMFYIRKMLQLFDLQTMLTRFQSIESEKIQKLTEQIFNVYVSIISQQE